jgi:hypothetical protein
MISWFPQNIHAMRSFSEMATPQITADHLPKYNLRFFFRSRRNNKQNLAPLLNMAMLRVKKIKN